MANKKLTYILEKKIISDSSRYSISVCDGLHKNKGDITSIPGQYIEDGVTTILPTVEELETFQCYYKFLLPAMRTKNKSLKTIFS